MLLGEHEKNLSKVKTTVHYNDDIFSERPFLKTLANVGSIYEVVAKCNCTDAKDPNNPLFYNALCQTCLALTSRKAIEYLKHCPEGKKHHIWCWTAQQLDAIHGQTVISTTQPRNVLMVLSNQFGSISVDPWRQAHRLTVDLQERLFRFFTSTEMVPIGPLAIAKDNQIAKARMEAVKTGEERERKRTKLSDDSHLVTPKDKTKVEPDKSGCVVFKGSGMMPMVQEWDIAERRCLPTIREGMFCKKKGVCKHCHENEKDPLKWKPSIAKSWDDLIQANAQLEWAPHVNAEKPKAHIAKQ
jgi:hypothetical protein